MPDFGVEKTMWALNEAGKALKGSRVHVLGIAYKRNIDDVRESPALDVMHLLRKRGAIISYSDPYIPKVTVGTESWTATETIEGVRQSDCAVIITDHSGVDYRAVLDAARLVVDTRNALKGIESEKLWRL
jgi:UDP-N-acetyl-D-glucosamine dehydrogenase